VGLISESQTMQWLNMTETWVGNYPNIILTRTNPTIATLLTSVTCDLSDPIAGCISYSHKTDDVILHSS
jgi:hypothetical protein